MAMFDLRVMPDDGEPFDVEAGMRDVVMWEKTHRGRSLSMLGDGGLSATMVYELAYSACRRQQLIPRELTEAQFSETHEIDVETPDAKQARRRAEDLKQRIVDAELPPPAADEPLDVADSEPGGDDADPTRPEVSPGA